MIWGFAAAKICVLESEEELEDFTVEIDILSEVRHENIIELFEAYYHQDKLWVSQGLLHKLRNFRKCSSNANSKQTAEFVGPFSVEKRQSKSMK